MAKNRRARRRSPNTTQNAVVRHLVEELARAKGFTPPDPTIYGVPQMSSSKPARPFHWDNPFFWGTQYNPKRRPGLAVSVDTLRTIADTYDILRSCINHLKREVWTSPIAFAPCDPDMDPERLKKLVAAAEDFFSDTGGLGGPGRRRTHFEGELVEDLCVVGASAVFCERTRGGQVLSAECIDAATIRPVVDAWGWRAEHPYEQWAMGAKVTDLDDDELIYDGLWSLSWQPYFRSPVEWLLAAVTSALKADEWNREYLVSGNTPGDILSLPADWSPGQVKEFAAFWDMILSGNTPERRKTKFVPGGSTRMQGPITTDREFADLELWLLRRTCSIIGVQPASIGYVGEQYKVSQDASMDQTSRFGAGAVVEFRNSVFDRLLERIGLGELHVVPKPDEPKEEPKDKADRVTTLIKGKVYTPNEGRAEYGLDPKEGADELEQAPEPFAGEFDGKASGEDKESGKDDGAKDGATRIQRGGIVIDWRPTPKRRKQAEAMFKGAKDLFDTKAARVAANFARDYFSRGDEALADFSRDFVSAVLVGHRQAAQAGGTLTGVSKPVAIDVGKGEGEEQKPFIEKLVDDIRNARVIVSDEDAQALVDSLVLPRMQLYSNRLTGTANKAAAVAVPPETEVWWRLEPGAEHCEDCPALAAMSPYTMETLPCHPGDGFTQCGANCECGLHLKDGTYISIHDWSSYDAPDFPERVEALRKWEKKAVNRIRAGKSAVCGFSDPSIDAALSDTIMARLARCSSADDVRAALRA